MEKATKIATQTGLKLEDAERQLGMAFGVTRPSEKL